MKLHDYCSTLIHLCARLRECSFFWTLCLKTFHLGTVCVCLAWSSPLPRILDIYCTFIVKLETGDSQDLKYGVYRVIGSGATVQSVSRCLLVVKIGYYSFFPRWNEEAATLESFDQRVKLYEIDLSTMASKLQAAIFDCQMETLRLPTWPRTATDVLPHRQRGFSQ